MFPKQHADNPNPKITPTWTAKPLLLSDLNMFLPHPSILMSHNDEAVFLAARKLGTTKIVALFIYFCPWETLIHCNSVMTLN